MYENKAHSHSKNAKLHTDGQFITTNFTFPCFQIASLHEGETHTRPAPSQLTQSLFC